MRYLEFKALNEDYKTVTVKFQQDNKIENLKAVCFKDPVIMEENKINQVPFYYSFSCEAIYADILNDL